jgi:thioredoxin reductase
MVACVSDFYDVVIVGGGAAGLSAALVLGRSCRSVLICDDGRPRNAVVARMHGFLSRDGTPPAELLALARTELERYPSVRRLRAHIARAQRNGTEFVVVTDDGTRYSGRRLVLATGVYDAIPPIEGIAERWGRSVFVCPYCDGWEMRGKRLAIIGNGHKAVELAQELRQWSSDLVVCTQEIDDLTPEDRRWLAATHAVIRSAAVRRIGSESQAQQINFADGMQESCDAIFLRAPLRQRYPLVDMLGCNVRADGEIDVDGLGRTSVPGCYAAGDAVTAVHQVALAAASGVCAAMGVNEDLVTEEVRGLIGSIS